MGRWLSLGIILFWVGMTTAHVKRVWFPSLAAQGGPPARELLLRALALGDSSHNLEVYYRGEWVGVVSYSIEDTRENGGLSGFKKLDVKGIATLPLKTDEGEVSERVGIRASMLFDGQGVVESLQAGLNLSGADLRLEVAYDASEIGARHESGEGGYRAQGEKRSGGRMIRAARYRIIQGEEILMDSANDEGDLVLAPSLLWLKPAIESSLAARTTVAGEHCERPGLRTRTELQRLAGRNRTVHVIEPQLDLAPPAFEIHLTEAGEIVRIVVLGDLDMRSVLLTMSGREEEHEASGLKQ